MDDAFNDNRNVTPIAARGTNDEHRPSVDNPILYQNTIADSFLEFTDNELRALTSLALNAMRSRGMPPPSVPPVVSQKPDIYDNARFE